jgi:hypothetical protein
LKISVLIAQYFYQNKVLNLPGIGSFYLDEDIDVQSIGNSRDLLEHIHFAQKSISRPDDSLIDFIRKHTGKIRPLAESDLETFVSDGKLMLNIGKPFHVEGVGTLQKNKDGVYEFTPGAPVVQRLEPLPALPMQEWEHEKPAKKKSVIDDNPYETSSNNTRRLLIGLGIVVGLTVIVWGGYTLYNSKTKEAVVAANNTPAATPADTTSRVSQYVHNIDSPAQALERVIKKDSLVLQEPVAPGETPATAAATPATPVTAPVGQYKFILETFTRQVSAMRRYNMLKPRVELETVDSNLYKIYIMLPGTPADTARMKDSLHNWYWGPRKDRSVKIEP